MLFNTLNLIFLNVTMPNWTTKICAQISLAGLYKHQTEAEAVMTIMTEKETVTAHR